MNRSLGILTCKDLPDLTGGEPLLLAELEERGIKPEISIWDGELSDHSHYLIRTTWDYYQRPNEFLNVIKELENSNRVVFNSSEIVKWNMDKAYLLELRDAYPKYVPETFLSLAYELGKTWQWIKDTKLEDLVLKPRVSAAGFGTFLTSKSEMLESFERWNETLARRDYLIQPYLPEVKENGEVSLVYFDGTYSHSVLKQAKDGEFRVQDDHGGTVHDHKASKEMLEAADQIIEKFKELPYTRIDFISTASGPQLMELELIEPELFLDYHEEAPARLAEAIVKRL